MQPQLEALPASTPEVLVGGNCEMAAFVTAESTVTSGCDLLKLIAQNTERATHDDSYPCGIHHVRQDYSKVLHPRILFVEYYRNVKRRWVLMAYLCCA
jgi:hypothetical protein